MNAKNITVVVNRPPDFSAAEKLRMSVGLTLEDGNRVRILFIGEGVCSVNGIGLDKNPANIEMDKSAETLGMMGAPLFVHEPSLRRYGVGADLYNAQLLDDKETADLLAGSAVIIS